MIPPIVILFLILVISFPITLPMLLIALFGEWRMSKRPIQGAK